MKVDRMEVISGGMKLAARLIKPRTGAPGILFVHGWAGSQQRDKKRSRALAELGCICLTFDMRGHGKTGERLRTVTPAQNMEDLCAAYDALAAHPEVDASSIGVISSSYGAYLAAMLTGFRKVRWLSLRVPALYRDDDWNKAKHGFDRRRLNALRAQLIPTAARRVIEQCNAYRGDVLIVESEKDEMVAHPAVASYLASFIHANSVTYRIIAGADHALSRPEFRRAYDETLTMWVREMVFGAR